MKQYLSFHTLTRSVQLLSCGALALALSFAVSSARADDTTTTTTTTTTPHKHHKKTVLEPTEPVTDSVSNTAAADTFISGEYASSQPKYGFGFATASHITGGSTALTGIINLSPLMLVQPLFSLNHTAGAMQLTAGGIFKYTIVKKGSSGLHVGGSLGLGWLAADGSSANNFAFDIGALVGFHFALPGTSDAIMLHLDGGAVFTHVNNSAEGSASYNDFAIDSISPALGLSVIYML